MDDYSSRYNNGQYGGRRSGRRGSRKPNKNLIFDCDFESGNIGKVDRLSEHEYDISIRPDTNNDRQRVWFHFRVSNVKKNQRVAFHIYNYSKKKSLFGSGFTPVVRSTSRALWERLPADQVYYNRCPRHRKRYCITIIFMFDQEEDYYFAYSYPYTYSDLQAYLDHLDYRHRVQGLLHHDTAGATSSRKHRNNNDIHNHNHSNSHSHSQNCIRDNGKMVKPYYSRELLTRTIQQRRLDMLVITDIDNLRVLQKADPDEFRLYHSSDVTSCDCDDENSNDTDTGGVGGADNASGTDKDKGGDRKCKDEKRGNDLNYIHSIYSLYSGKKLAPSTAATSSNDKSTCSARNNNTPAKSDATQNDSDSNRNKWNNKDGGNEKDDCSNRKKRESPLKITKKKVQVVVLTARVHPGETPASYVIQGVIDFLLSDHAAARALRKNVIFYIIPMLNPDGVAIGNYRCNVVGFDLNRHWIIPDRFTQPTIYHVKHFLLALGRNAAVSLDYFIDVHAHTTALNGFMYCNGDGVERGRDFPGSHRRFVRVKNDFHLSFDDNLPTFENHSIREKVGTGRQQKLDGATTDGGADDCMGEDESRSENEINGNNIHNHISTSSNAYSSGATRESATTLIRLANDEEDFPRLLDAHSKHFSFHKTRVIRGSKRAGSGRKAMGNFLAFCRTFCYTLEVSFFCSNNGGKKGDPYTEETYRKIGNAIAYTFSVAYGLPLPPAASSLSLVPASLSQASLSLSSSSLSSASAVLASSKTSASAVGSSLLLAPSALGTSSSSSSLSSSSFRNANRPRNQRHHDGVLTSSFQSKLKLYRSSSSSFIHFPPSVASSPQAAIGHGIIPDRDINQQRSSSINENTDGTDDQSDKGSTNNASSSNNTNHVNHANHDTHSNIKHKQLLQELQAIQRKCREKEKQNERARAQEFIEMAHSENVSSSFSSSSSPSSLPPSLSPSQASAYSLYRKPLASSHQSR